MFYLLDILLKLTIFLRYFEKGVVFSLEIWYTFNYIIRKKDGTGGFFMKKRIFIGSSSESLDVAHTIQENLERDFECTIWTQDVFKPSEYTLESLEETLDIFDYGVFVFSPDDELTIRGENSRSIRDNVLFEFGLFVGHLGREHVFFVVPRDAPSLHIPSDLVGITSLSYNAKRTDGNLVAALGPTCNKIAKEIKSRESYFIQLVRSKYDIMSNKYPLKRSIRYLDTACVFDSRTSFDNCIGIQRVFAQANEIKAVGISLNSIIINWGTNQLMRLIRDSNCKVTLLFLDPDGISTKERERDEQLPEGTIAQLTKTNINLVKKAISGLETNGDKLIFRIYDKMPFINMYIINNEIIILQHYLSGLRGQDSPVYVIRDEGNETGLFRLYNEIFNKIWDEAVALNE